ncbi:shikimate dehydrogenase [Aeromicrobium halocynthiae]|uniref:shikimate dehydrogenase family protein n=1 Tax=Aeromicrobium halocynthiae TaxID=560557 RepID=UPI0031DA7BCE
MPGGRLLVLRRCGVVGHPVAHSLSPAMHRAAYVHLGLDWTYDAVDVAPGALHAHVRGLDDTWRALSVTAPHKRDALALAESADDVATLVGGANTLLLDGSVRAANTDVPGAVAALRERGIGELGTVRVLGAGATAASLAVAVRELGAERLELVVRDADRARETVGVAEQVGLRVGVHGFGDAEGPGETDLLVSTIPGAGLVDGLGADPGSWLDGALAVFDVVYDPWPTRVTSAAVAAGLPTVTGLDLLAHQAAEQVRLMVDGDVSAVVLRDAALEELGRRLGTAARDRSTA